MTQGGDRQQGSREQGREKLQTSESADVIGPAGYQSEDSVPPQRWGWGDSGPLLLVDDVSKKWLSGPWEGHS